MTTSFSRSQTLALGPNAFLKMPNVPGPQTSWVMSTSTFTQTFSHGSTRSLREARARIFSVMVMAAGISAPRCVAATQRAARKLRAARWVAATPILSESAARDGDEGDGRRDDG